MPAGGEVGIDPILERGNAKFLEPCAFRLGEGNVDELLERRAPPEAESLAEPVRSSLWLSVTQLPASL